MENAHEKCIYIFQSFFLQGRRKNIKEEVENRRKSRTKIEISEE